MRFKLSEKFLLIVPLLSLIRRKTLQVLLNSLLLMYPVVRIRSIRTRSCRKVHVECRIGPIVADIVAKHVKIFMRSMQGCVAV